MKKMCLSFVSAIKQQTPILSGVCRECTLSPHAGRVFVVTLTPRFRRFELCRRFRWEKSENQTGQSSKTLILSSFPLVSLLYRMGKRPKDEHLLFSRRFRRNGVVLREKLKKGSQVQNPTARCYAQTMFFVPYEDFQWYHLRS